MISNDQIIDCACLIHSIGYDWAYVEKLHEMLQSNSSREIRLHVYTEEGRHVPPHMIKHPLIEWPGVGGPKKSWWYKMQMFNSRHHSGPLLYLDLDVIIVRNIDWIFKSDLAYFWAIHDFRYLWRSHWPGMNSSMMFWDTRKWHHIWEKFETLDLKNILRNYHGDQDYLNVAIPQEQRKFLDPECIKSWRWQCQDGGMDVRTKKYRRPNAGTVLDPRTCVMIFHGNPKPHQIDDPLINGVWPKPNNAH